MLLKQTTEVTQPLIEASSFTAKLKSIATNDKTVYAWGMFGSQITKASVSGKARQYPSWYTASKLNNVFVPLYGSNPLTWGFDCIGLIKGVLWGWSGETSKTYGGAVYASNGVPDLSADTMITRCSGISSDFSYVTVGEFLWTKGHCGIYIGNGLAVESTPAWKNGVQITACNCTRSGYKTRYWTKHGKLPYISYHTHEEASTSQKEESKTVTIELAVLRKGSTGETVKTLQRLLNAQGYKSKDSKALAVDGDFGSNTAYALENYQRAKKLEADAICGPATWRKLLIGK